MALRDQTLLALVNKLDRVLDRDDVIRARTVDQIDQSAQGRRLSRSRGSRDENESLGEMAKALYFLGDAHLLDGYDCRGDGAKYRARSLAFPECVAAEAGDAWNRSDLATRAQQRRRAGTQMQVGRVAADKRPEKGLDPVERTVAGCGCSGWFHDRGFERRSLDAWR